MTICLSTDKGKENQLHPQTTLFAVCLLPFVHLQLFLQK